MKRSRNEISGLVLKAGRGAGLPLGVAEDLAMAVPHMDTEALAELAALLTDPAHHSDLCALCAALDAQACGVTVNPPDCGTALPAAMTAVRVGTAPHRRGPMEVDASLWTAFDRLAQKTYVPATEASRASGAGAGLSDND